MVLLDDAVHRKAAEQPDEPAVVTDLTGVGDTLTWVALDQRSARVRDEITAAASSSASCVVVPVGRSDSETAVSLVAGLRTNLPVMVVRQELNPIAYSNAAALAGAEDEVLALGLAPIVLHPDRPVALERRPTQTVRQKTGPSAAAVLTGRHLILTTGGSSGGAKWVTDPVIRQIGARPDATRPVLRTGWHPGQRQLLFSPLYHASGLTYFVEGLFDGNTSHLWSSDVNPSAVDVVDAYAIEWMQMVPFHMTRALEREPAPRFRRPPFVFHLAGACAYRVKRAWHDAVGSDRVFEMYNASERIGMTLACGDEWDARPGTVGKGFFTSIAILDPDFRPLPAGEVGEVYLRSGRVNPTPYLQRAGRLKLSPDGYATLGDLGRLDEDGYLYLEARQLVTISVAGVTVVAEDVEAVLKEHDSVLDAAVVGQADERFGERVVALVVAGEGTDPRALRNWARERLSSSQLPATILLRDRLPRSAAGKLDRSALPGLLTTETKAH